MGRRPLAGRDRTIIQGQRRDEFFKKMRRKGGVPRLPTQAPTAAEAKPEETSAEAPEETTADEVLTAEASGDHAEAASIAESSPVAQAQ